MTVRFLFQRVVIVRTCVVPQIRLITGRAWNFLVVVVHKEVAYIEALVYKSTDSL